MPLALDQLGNGASIAVLRLRSLGDCVLTTPALHLLKRYRPDLRVSIIVQPQFAPIFSGNTDIDHILSPTAAEVSGVKAQLTVNLHGGTRSLLLTLASLARLRAGFGHYRYQAAYNIRIPRAQDILGVTRKVHTAEHVASAMFYLGVPQCEIPRARLFPLQQLPAGPPYAVIHPFASLPSKTWPAARFRDVAASLSQKGIEPIFIGAPSDPLTAFEPYRTFTPPLEQTKSLLAAASFFLGNDSGPAHMAAAFGIPMTVIFADSDHEVWHPWKTQAETIIATAGMESVSVRQVLEAIERLRVKA